MENELETFGKRCLVPFLAVRRGLSAKMSMSEPREVAGEKAAHRAQELELGKRSFPDFDLDRLLSFKAELEFFANVLIYNFHN